MSGAVALGNSVFSTDLASGSLIDRLEQTCRPNRSMPLLVALGDADRLVALSVQAAYVQARWDAGQDVDYRSYPGLDRVSLVKQIAVTSRAA